MNLEDNLNLITERLLPDVDESRKKELLDALMRVTRRNGGNNDINDLLEYLGYNKDDIATKIAISYLALSRLINTYPVLSAATQELADKVANTEFSDFDALYLVQKCVDWKIKARGTNPHIYELLESITTGNTVKTVEETVVSEEVIENTSSLPNELSN